MTALGRRLSRTKPHREAMLRNLVTSLLEHGSVVSTHEKCVEASKLADRVVHWAKKAQHSPEYLSMIQAQLFLSGNNNHLLKRLCGEIAPRYVERPGGYTRVLHLEPRLGDRARQSVLELVDTPVVTYGPEGKTIERGNVKLWLLGKSALHDETESHGVYNEKTLTNLKKMMKFRDREALVTDLLAIRSILRRDAQMEPVDESEDKKLVNNLLDKAQEVQVKITRRKPLSGYKFESARPA